MKVYNVYQRSPGCINIIVFIKLMRICVMSCSCTSNQGISHVKTTGDSNNLPDVLRDDPMEEIMGLLDPIDDDPDQYQIFSSSASSSVLACLSCLIS